MKFELKIYYRGHNNSLYELESAGFTKLNYVPGTTTNSLLDATSPRGILGGSVAGLKGDLVTGACGTTDAPLGLFINNAAGYEWENDYAEASGKAPFVNGQGTYGVFIYETHNEAGTAALTYAAGDWLYCSVNGLLTKEAPGANNVNPNSKFWLVVKAPTSTDPEMIVEQKI